MGKPDQGSAAAEGARRATGDAAGPGRGGRLSCLSADLVLDCGLDSVPRRRFPERVPGGGRPFGPAEVEAMRGAYGQRICRVWHCARSSVYARRQATTSQVPCRRRGPVGAAPDVLVGYIRRVLEASPFHGEGYRNEAPGRNLDGSRLSGPMGRAHGPA